MLSSSISASNRGLGPNGAEPGSPTDKRLDQGFRKLAAVAVTWLCDEGEVLPRRDVGRSAL